MIPNIEIKCVDGEKLKYPKSVFVILLHQAFERFSFWGIVVVLPLFLRNVLGFDDDSSTSMYHGFSIFGYLSAFVGATLADSFLGKFWTIASFSVLYFVGTFLLTLSAIPALLSSECLIWIAIFGMALTALASGSIKPCIIAFGGDQYILPEQNSELKSYFTILLLVINFVLLCTAILTPMMRQGMSCFGQDTCYPLTFAVPLGLVIIASLIFILGKNSYRIQPVKRNVVWDALRCIKFAISEKRRDLNKLGGITGKKDKKENHHWLDTASDQFGEKFVQDLKRVLKLVVLFLPVTTFWALFDQQFSRWTFQASRMNGDMFGYLVKPDQVAIVNFILTFLLIPVFDKWLYPAFGKFGLLKKSLQRVVCGCALASVSFIICACVELRVESTLDSLPLQHEAHLNIINMIGSPIHVQGLGKDFTDQKTILPTENHIFKKIPVFELPFTLKNIYVSAEEGSSYSETMVQEKISMSGGKGYTLLIYSGPNSNQTFEAVLPKKPDDIIKSLESNVKLGVICSHNLKQLEFYLSPDDDPSETITLSCGEGDPQTIELQSRRYSIKVGEQILVPSTHLGTGGSYIFGIAENGSSIVGGIYTIREPNSVSMFWLFPQYLIMSMAEVLLEIPLTGFAYEQAPTEMKSLLQVVNLIPPAFGGILVVILAKAKLFESQAHEFFLFAGVNIFSVLVLIYLAKEYKPLGVSPEEESGSDMTTVEYESEEGQTVENLPKITTVD